MTDYKERACVKCGSFLHHEDSCGRESEGEIDNKIELIDRFELECLNEIGWTDDKIVSRECVRKMVRKIRDVVNREAVFYFPLDKNLPPKLIGYK